MGKAARQKGRAERKQDREGMILSRLQAQQCMTCGRGVAPTVVLCGTCAARAYAASKHTNPPATVRIRIGGAVEGDLTTLDPDGLAWLITTLDHLTTGGTP